jgi:hypothetical protein
VVRALILFFYGGEETKNYPFYLVE